MVQDKEGFKAELLAAAAASIDELIAWDECHEKPTLGEIEGVVLKVRQELGEQMVTALIQRQESVNPVPGPICATCGQEMRYKNSSAKQVSSWAGDLDIQRNYYYCPCCRSGFFPPGPAT